MTRPLDQTISRFAGADRQTRLELLLDYAKKLPALPEQYRAARDQGLNRVPECQSPVFLFVEAHDGKVTLHADAPVEAPTVRGFVSLLGRAIHDADLASIEAIPSDLIDRLGLSEALGMMRMQGLTAVLGRVKRMAREAAGEKKD